MYKDADIEFYHDLDVLAGLGSSGRCPNHCASELRDKLNQSSFAAPFVTQLPIRNAVTNTTFLALQHMILPHEWFANMYEKYPEAFRERICPGHDKLNEFWREMDRHPQMLGHPLKGRARFSSWAIPIALHGDGVPVTGLAKSWGKTMLFLSWCSLVGSGSTTELSFYIYGLWKLMMSKAWGRNTMRLCWRIISWSLHCLWTGEWPSHDWQQRPLTNPMDIARRGKRLAGNYFCVLWTLRNDLEYNYTDLGLPNSGTNEHPCTHCPANTTTMPLNDFRPGAAWRANTYDEAQWRTTQWCTHELFNLVHGGVGLFSIMADLMHCKHLGTDQYFYGSVLWLLCFRILPHTPEANCIFVFNRIKVLYARDKTPCRYANLFLNMFCVMSKLPTSPTGAFPCLKGRAAECRHIGKAILEIWREHMNASIPQHVQIRIALEKSVNIERILDENPRTFRFTDETGIEFKDSIFTFLVMFHALASFYASPAGGPLMLFNVTIKAHYLAHIGIMGVHMNPRLSWCYSGEDFMHHARRLASGCAKGTKPDLISKKFCFGYSVGMHIIMTESDSPVLLFRRG